jgi:preprotein translocase YajC subunit
VTFPLALLMAPTDSPSGGLGFWLPFQLVGFGLVFYFLLFRPQQQARKRHEELLKTLKKGDEVVTSGGIVGKVKGVESDRVTVESGTSTLVIERARIIKVGDKSAPGQLG